jgi:hypothetical protein
MAAPSKGNTGKGGKTSPPPSTPPPTPSSTRVQVFKDGEKVSDTQRVYDYGAGKWVMPSGSKVVGGNVVPAEQAAQAQAQLEGKQIKYYYDPQRNTRTYWVGEGAPKGAIQISQSSYDRGGQAAREEAIKSGAVTPLTLREKQMAGTSRRDELTQMAARTPQERRAMIERSRETWYEGATPTPKDVARVQSMSGYSPKFTELYEQRRIEATQQPTTRQEFTSSLQSRIKEKGGLKGIKIETPEAGGYAVIPESAKYSSGFESQLGTGKPSKFVKMVSQTIPESKKKGREMQYYTREVVNQLYSRFKKITEPKETFLSIKTKTGLESVAKRLPKFEYKFKKEKGKELGYYLGVGLKGEYKAFKSKPYEYTGEIAMNVLYGAATAGVIGGVSKLAIKSGLATTFGKFLAARTPLQQKLIYKAPKAITTGLFFAPTIKEVITTESPSERARAIAKFGIREAIPFTIGGSIAEKAIGISEPIRSRIRSQAKSPIKMQLEEIKTVGKTKGIKTMEYEYGYTTKLPSGEIKIKTEPLSFLQLHSDVGNIEFKQPKYIGGKAYGAQGQISTYTTRKTKVEIPISSIRGGEFKIETPFQRQISARHELIHGVKTPRIIFDAPSLLPQLPKGISIKGYDYLRYRAEPAEILAFAGQRIPFKFTATMGGRDYARIIQPRTATFYKKDVLGLDEGITTLYERRTVPSSGKPFVSGKQKAEMKVLGQYEKYKKIPSKVEFGGQAPIVAMQKGFAEKAGFKYKIQQINVGREPTGVIRTPTLDIYFKKQIGGDLKLKYVAKGSRIKKTLFGKSQQTSPAVLKQVTIPYKKPEKVIINQILERKPKTEAEGLSQFFKDGGTTFDWQKIIRKTKTVALVGQKTKYSGIFKTERGVTGVAKSYLKQVDTSGIYKAGFQKMKFAEISSAKRPPIRITPRWEKPTITEASQATIKYVKQVGYRKPTKFTIKKSTTEGLIREFEIQPSLKTERKSAFEYLITFAEQKKVGFKPLPKLGKKGTAKLSPLITQQQRVIEAKAPPALTMPKIPKSSLEPILDIGIINKIIEDKPRSLTYLIDIPRFETAKASIPKSTFETGMVVRNKQINKIIPLTITKPTTITKRETITKPMTITIPTTRTISETRAITKPETITRAITKTITESKTITEQQTISKQITITKTKLPRLFKLKIPKKIPPPPLVPSFKLELTHTPRFNSYSKKSKKYFSSYSPTLIGETFMPKIKATAALGKMQFAGGLSIRPQIKIPIPKMKILKPMKVMAI